MEIEELGGLAGTDLIQDTFLFQLFDFDETMAMAELFQKESRKKGEVIIDEGELGQALYIVEEGQVKVVKGAGKHKEELAKLGRSELFGEMSLIENELTSASVVAATDVSLLVIKRQDFEDLMEQNRDIALKVYKTFCFTLSERLRRTSEELGRLKSCHDEAPPENTTGASPKPGKGKSRQTSTRKKAKK